MKMAPPAMNGTTLSPTAGELHVSVELVEWLMYVRYGQKEGKQRKTENKQANPEHVSFFSLKHLLSPVV